MPAPLRTQKLGSLRKREQLSDSQSDSEWGGIESDNDGGVVFNNFSTTSEAATARTQSKTPGPGRRTTPRHDSDRLLSKTTSPVPPNARPESQSREVIWIRETPINEATTLPENAGNVNNHIQRPRQTARMIWIRDTPDVDNEQTSMIHPEEEVDFARITPELTQASSTPSAEASGSALVASTKTQSPLKDSVAMSSLTAVNTETIVDMAEPSSSESGRVELFEAEIRRIVEAATAMLKKQQRVREAENENQQVSYSGRRQREMNIEIRNRWGKSKSRKAERVSQDLKHKNKGKGKRRSSGRTQAELRAAMERKRTEAAVEAEV